MLIRRSSPVRNFTVLPNEFLQDERMTWATRGLLAEVLSRPSGWTASADSLSERARRLRPDAGRGEGRRATRAMFAEAKRFGYIVAEKERIGPGEDGAGRFRTVLAFYDSPQLGTASGTSVPPAETSKGQVAPGTASGTSVSGTSIERTEEKEPRSTKTPAIAEAGDKSPPSHETPAAIAEACAAAQAPKTGYSIQKTAKIPKQRQPYPSNQKRDALWRAQIAAADPGELEGVADALSVGKHYNWACRQASFRLGFGTGGTVPGKLYDPFVRHMYLYLLKDVAATDPLHMVELEGPLSSDIKAERAPFKRNHTVHVPAGETADSFSAQMIEVLAQTTPEELGPWAGEIEDRLPGLWYEKRQEAHDLLRKQKLPREIETIAAHAVRLMIEHYRDKPEPKWPAEVAPPSLRSAFPAQSAPPVWVA